MDDIDESHLVTRRAARSIAYKAFKSSFEDVADEFSISPNTCKAILTEYVDDMEKTFHFVTPSFLGIDEIKIKKLGEITVITDLEHRTLYDMTQGRSQQDLNSYFSKIPDLENVLWVCTDMYRPFQQTLGSIFPNARWVIDHFHIVAYANRAMDNVRKEIQSKLTKKQRVQTKKGLAYTLRTRLRDLSPEEAGKIRKCRNSSIYAPLAIAYDLKEDFFNIYDEHRESKEGAQQAFEEWVRTIPDDPVYESFRDLEKTVRNFYEQIFNYWDCPISITNAFTECTNRIIRENNVRGRGSSFKILRDRTLFRKTNLANGITNGVLQYGPSISKNTPIFRFDEDNSSEPEAPDYSNSINSFDYDPLFGLTPGEDYDPDTGIIYDDLEDGIEEDALSDLVPGVDYDPDTGEIFTDIEGLDNEESLMDA